MPDLPAMLDGSSPLLEDRQPECSAEDNLNSLAMVVRAIQTPKRKKNAK